MVVSEIHEPPFSWSVPIPSDNKRNIRQLDVKRLCLYSCSLLSSFESQPYVSRMTLSWSYESCCAYIRIQQVFRTHAHGIIFCGVQQLENVTCCSFFLLKHFSSVFFVKQFFMVCGQCLVNLRS